MFGVCGLGHEAGGLRPPLASPAPTSLTCPHQSRLPPPASSAPICLACPHGEEEGSALVLGIGLRLWQSALSFPSLSFVYKVHSFPSLWIDRQLSFFVLSLLLSTFLFIFKNLIGILEAPNLPCGLMELVLTEH